MRPVLALAVKDLRLLLRLRAGLFFTFVWPILVAVGFGVILGGGGDERHSSMPVIVVDEDHSVASQAFVDRLRSGGELDLATGSRADAEQAVRKGRRAAYIILAQGFGAASERMFYGEPPRVALGIDPSHRAEAGMIEGVLMKHGVEGMQKLFSDPAAGHRSIESARQSLPPAGTSSRTDATARMLSAIDGYLAEQGSAQGASAGHSGPEMNWQPLVVDKVAVTGQRDGPQTPFDFTFPQGVLWGVLGCVMSFAIGLVVERTHGTLVRLQTAPISRAQVLGGKALACFVTAVGLQAMLYAIGIVIFHVRVHSFALLVTAILSIAVAFVGIMMLVASFGRTEQTTSAAGWALLMPLSMIGGGMVPLFVMPGWLVRMSSLSPVKWAILALEGATWRAFSPADMLLPCAVLIAVGCTAFFVGTKAVRTL